eukprot:gene18069-21523_t
MDPLLGLQLECQTCLQKRKKDALPTIVESVNDPGEAGQPKYVIQIAELDFGLAPSIQQ